MLETREVDNTQGPFRKPTSIRYVTVIVRPMSRSLCRHAWLSLAT